MDPVIAAALIGGVFALAAAAIPGLLRRRRREAGEKAPWPTDPMGGAPPNDIVASALGPQPATGLGGNGSATALVLSVRVPPDVPDVVVSVNGIVVFEGGVNSTGALRARIPALLHSESELRVQVFIPGFQTAECAVANPGGLTELTADFTEMSR